MSHCTLQGVSSAKFPPAEDMQKGLQDIEELIEQTKKAQQQNKITVDNYVIPLGKFRGMTAKSLINIETVNKYGKSEPTGKKYIAWLINQEWLHDKDKQILSKILMV